MQSLNIDQTTNTVRFKKQQVGLSDSVNPTLSMILLGFVPQRNYRK